MKPLTIIMQDRVGLISDMSYVLGKERINIDGIDANVVGKKIVVTILVKNPGKAMEILKRNGFSNFDSEYIVVKIGDKPGEMAKVTELLKKKKVNILHLHQIPGEEGEALVAIKTNRPRASREILKPFMVSDLEG
jgi:hypothetical protein